MRKLVVRDNRARNIAKLLLGRIFDKPHYRKLSIAIGDRHEREIENLVRTAAEKFGDVSEEIITGVNRILLIAIDARPITSFQHESMELQLGRIREFCEQCTEGNPDEMQQLSLDELPTWLERK